MPPGKTAPVIMIMIDGFGIPEGGYHCPVYSRYCVPGFLDLLEKHSIPIDAHLDVNGLPQSATGQCSLFCGINAAKILGAHLQGFPNKKLRDAIRNKNIFKTLIEKGETVTFANAYIHYDLEDLERIGMRSVTTIMTQNEIGEVRNIDDLLRGDAVYHDLTREVANSNSIQRWKKNPPTARTPVPRYPEISPEQAADDLARIAQAYDFTLFEYFMTDRAGHKRTEELLDQALGNFSRFFVRLIEETNGRLNVIMTSDHGNCEDINVRSHTENPVPFFRHGSNLPNVDGLVSIVGVHDYIVRMFSPQ